MHRFHYQATNSEQTVVHGELTAESVADAVRELEQQGLILNSIERVVVSAPLASAQRNDFWQRISRVIDKRKNWIPAIAALANETPPGPSRRALQQLVAKLQGNLTPEEFLSKRSTAALLPLLNSSDRESPDSRQLQSWLGMLDEQLKSSLHIRRSFYYPLFLVGVCLLLTVFFAVTIIPTFRTMFGEFGLRLPPPTLLTLWFSAQLTQHALRTLVFGCLLGGGCVLLVSQWRRHAITNRIFGRFVAGSSSNLLAMSTLCSTLAELLQMKIPVEEAIRLSGTSCEHSYFSIAAAQLSKELKHSGFRIEQTRSIYRFPRLLQLALTSRNPDGVNVELIRELAELYRHRAQLRSNWIFESLPSLVIVFVGGLVAFVIVSLFLPLVSMITSLA
ncbi:type II secretion system F family protein [Aureliella helgolandensis]|uniref:Type IV pilin biogenesis protein n=1 Tax=Aureliella helgolandensis TaxID=2527968 RepID=A0A518G7K5_9BACT|nr:type II secretion system F family protein [Aureliella helgolandensis]QDV24559.1 type IV pilin biogenesis protein [Aureliella helgolandensis]